MRFKKPAEINIGIELDKDVLDAWPKTGQIQLIHSDAINYLAAYPFIGDEFIYVDPPYLSYTRQSDRAPYKIDYSEEQHIALLEMLSTIPCNVMISGYCSPLYERHLAEWRVQSFVVRTRSGAEAEEFIWMNYPAPVELHDYSYLGETFRERERIRRRIERWRARLESLPPLERNALLSALPR
ncbi:MAG: DNA adenine methylase [Candidatus Thiodiazotropha sp.]